MEQTRKPYLGKKPWVDKRPIPFYGKKSIPFVKRSGFIKRSGAKAEYKIINNIENNYRKASRTKIFKASAKKLSDRGFFSRKYRQFIDSVKNVSQSKVLSLLPFLILSITVIAVKNKALLKPMLDSYKYVFNKEETSPFMEKVLAVIIGYISILSDFDFLEKSEAVVSLVSLVTENIPDMIKQLKYHADYTFLTTVKHILRNIIDVKKYGVKQAPKDYKQFLENQEQTIRPQASKAMPPSKESTSKKPVSPKKSVSKSLSPSAKDFVPGSSRPLVAGALTRTTKK